MSTKTGTLQAEGVLDVLEGGAEGERFGGEGVPKAVGAEVFGAG